MAAPRSVAYPGINDMRNPLKAIDQWASQSDDRTSMVMWIVVLGIVVLLAGAMTGLYVVAMPDP